MDGLDLDGVGVGFESPFAGLGFLGAELLPRVADRFLEPGEYRPEALLSPCAVHRFGDVVEVGHEPLPVGTPQDPFDETGSLGEVGDESGDPVVRQQFVPSAHLHLEFDGGVVVESSHGGEVLADEDAGGGISHGRCSIGSFDTEEEPSPLVGGFRDEDTPRSRGNRWHSPLCEFLSHHVDLFAGAAQHGDIPGVDESASLLAVDLDLRMQQAHHSRGHVGCDHLPGVGGLEGPGSRHASIDRHRCAEPADRQRRPRSVHAGTLVVGCGPDLAVLDAFVTERHPVEDGVQRRDERPVAPPVGEQRVLGLGPVDARKIRLDVGAAEGVDRLLRVADDDEPGLVEHSVDDFPLDRVRVLGLVDEGHGEPLREDLPRVFADPGVGKRIAGFEKELIEPCAAAGPQPPVDLGACRRRELGTNRRRPDDPGGVGSDVRIEIGRHGLGDVRQRCGVDKVSGVVGEPGDDQIGDDLRDEFGVHGDGFEVGRDPGMEAEMGEEPDSEAVDRVDLSPVEPDDRFGETLDAALPGCVVGIEEDPYVVVCSGCRGGAGEDAERLDEAVADPPLEFSGRGPGERDNEDPIDGDARFCNESGHLCGDGERLACAGAGFDDAASFGDRLGGVERLHGGHTVSSSLTSRIGSHSRSA